LPEAATSKEQAKALKMASCSLITPASSLASSSLRKLFSSRNSMATVGLLSFAPKTSSFILHSIKQRAYHESSFRGDFFKPCYVQFLILFWVFVLSIKIETLLGFTFFLV
jgi:hypothetical protein